MGERAHADPVAGVVGRWYAPGLLCERSPICDPQVECYVRSQKKGLQSREPKATTPWEGNTMSSLYYLKVARVNCSWVSQNDRVSFTFTEKKKENQTRRNGLEEVTDSLTLNSP